LPHKALEKNSVCSAGQTKSTQAIFHLERIAWSYWKVSTQADHVMHTS